VAGSLAMTGTGTTTANDRRLWIAVGVSLLLHATILSLHFRFPEASRRLQGKVLDIVLVNARSARKPDDAQVLAQANLDGGGNSDEERIAQTPLPASPREQPGDELKQAQQRVQELEAQQRQLLAQVQADKKAAPPVVKTQASPEASPAPSPVTQPAAETPVLRGRDLASSALETMRLEAVIARQTEEYNKRPRIRPILSARAEEYRFAQYEDAWRIKVERIGTLNYPQAARGKLSGSLTLTVVINRDGSLARVEIDRPSGHRVLDEAAKRIVGMAAPFAEFPADIRREWDQLSITRTFIFTSSNRLETQSR
jgi:protein TonB